MSVPGLVMRVAITATVVAAGCSREEPPVLPRTPTAPTGDAASSKPARPVARLHGWVPSEGGWIAGPAVERGTMAVVGGRRYRSNDAGVLEVEAVSVGAPITQLTTIATGKGEILVGVAGGNVLRFDDPLGAGVVIGAAKRIGSARDLVLAWQAEARPTFIDPWTGTEAAAPAGLPALPVGGMEMDARGHGVALFYGAGHAATSDGGATWTQLLHVGARIDGLRKVGKGLLGDCADASVLELHPASLRQVPHTEAAPDATLRLAFSTLADPLQLAMREGLKSGPRTLMVPLAGQLVEIDVTTGMVVRSVVLEGMGARPKRCRTTRRGATFYVGCELSGGARVHRVRTLGGVLQSQQIFDAPGRAPLVATFSGGLLLRSACASASKTTVCVMQPDESFVDVPVSGPLRGLAPLADGSAAFFDGEGTAADPLRLVVASAKARTPLEPLPPMKHSPRGTIEEDAQGRLVALLDSSRGSVLIEQPRNGPARVVPRDARNGALRAGVAALWTGETKDRPDQLELSSDGGRTWRVVPTPPRVFGWASEVMPGELGIALKRWVRVGVEDSEFSPPPGDTTQHRFVAREPPFSLRCATTTGAASQGSPQPRARRRGESLVTFPDRRGLYEAAVEVKSTSALVREITLQFLDRTTIGARPVRVPVRLEAPPLDDPDDLHIRGVVARGDAALVELGSGGKSFAVSVKGKNVRVWPSAPALYGVALGPDGSAIYDDQRTTYGLGPGGAAFEIVQRVGMSVGRVEYGTPSSLGAPMVLTFAGYGVARTLPFNGSKLAASGVLPIDGWQSVALNNEVLTAIRPCAKGASAAIRLRREGENPISTGASVDGKRLELNGIAYDLVSDGTSACLGLAAMVSQSSKSSGIELLVTDFIQGRSEIEDAKGHRTPVTCEVAPRERP